MKIGWIVILVAVGVSGQEVPRALAQYGAFAFPDASGTRLIAVAGMPGAAKVRTVLCSDGSRIPVRFERRQAARKDDDGRQMPSRFDRLAGDVFRVVRGRVGLTASCFLAAADGWISGATAIAVHPVDGDSACSSGMAAEIATSKGRAVVRCFSVGRLEGDGRVVLVEFARRGKDALASVVVMHGGRMLFGDYAAQFRGDGEDLWRVDDGGVLSAEGFNVVFVVKKGEQYWLGVSWAGTEGRSLALFVSDSGSAFRRLIEDYWYQAPD